MKFRYQYFILLLVAALGFVGLFSFYRFFFVKPTYVYVKVKLGQGLWWASTIQPPVWFIKALKKGEKESGLNIQSKVAVIKVNFYPYFIYVGSTAQLNDQYRVFLTLKLKADQNKNTGEYSFDRSTLAVGSPIQIDLPSVSFTGTVTELDKKPFSDPTIEKTITLKKALDDNILNGLQIGDEYFNGEETSLKIIDKYVDGDYLFIKAKIKVKEISHQLIFGEEQIIAVNNNFSFMVGNSVFYNFIVQKID